MKSLLEESESTISSFNKSRVIRIVALKTGRVALHLKGNKNIENDSLDLSSLPFSILFRDEAILVINKPANLLSVPGLGCSEHSVQSLLSPLFPELRMVHRLDYATSGIMLMAMNKSASQHLNFQFRERTVRKMYHATVTGKIVKEGVVELPILQDPSNPMKNCVHRDGKASTSKFVRVNYNEESDESSVHLFPVTGRTHQLRVHMMAVGHPMIGDPKYAPEEIRTKSSRLHLHAATLTLQHPWSHELFTISAPCPF